MRLTGNGPAGLERVKADLRLVPGRLREQIARDLGPAAQAAARRSQADILDMPARYQRGLRAQVARTITAQSRRTRRGAKAVITSDASKMPPGKAVLPRRMDSPYGWSHPVFGHRDRQVRQRGDPRWFEGDPGQNYPTFRAAIERAIRRIAARVR